MNSSDGTSLAPVSAILLDAGGVLVFPEPDLVLPPLNAAGVTPDLATLEKAHYRAMAVQDAAGPAPTRDTWWHDYLRTYVAACGVTGDRPKKMKNRKPSPKGKSRVSGTDRCVLIHVRALLIHV